MAVGSADSSRVRRPLTRTRTCARTHAHTNAHAQHTHHTNTTRGCSKPIVNDTKNQETERDQIEVFEILNRYENIDNNIFVRLRKREGLEDMELH